MNPWVDPRVGDVTPEQARRYLLAHGWHQKPYDYPPLWAFDGPPDDGGEAMRLFSPSKKAGRTYAACVERLISSLAVIEDRPAAAVLEEMLASAPAAEPRVNGTLRGRKPKEAAG